MTEDKVNPQNYKEHLIDAFSYIIQDPIIDGIETGHIIKNSSEQIVSKLKSNFTSKVWTFKIDPPWILYITEGRRSYFKHYDASLVLGGKVTVSNSIFLEYASYVTIIRNSWASEKTDVYDSCCENNSKEKNRVVRRFHFDTSNGIPDIFETKSHMQFGGFCNEEAAIIKHIGKPLHYCLDNKLLVPRFPYPPIDIIILFDLIIRQFPTTIDKDFVLTQEWINIVKKSECFRLKKYYFEIKKYYDKMGTHNQKNKKTLFETMCEKDFSF